MGACVKGSLDEARCLVDLHTAARRLRPEWSARQQRLERRAQLEHPACRHRDDEGARAERAGRHRGNLRTASPRTGFVGQHRARAVAVQRHHRVELVADTGVAREPVEFRTVGSAPSGAGRPQALHPDDSRTERLERLGEQVGIATLDEVADPLEALRRTQRRSGTRGVDSHARQSDFVDIIPEFQSFEWTLDWKVRQT